MFYTRFLVLLTLILYINAQQTEWCPCESYDTIENECRAIDDRLTCSPTTHTDRHRAIKRATIARIQLNIEDWPYLVSLQRPYLMKGRGCYRHFCGGALIAPNLVITAAHCTDKMDMRFSYPEVYVAQVPPCRHLGSSYDEYRRYVINAHIHPDFQIQNPQPNGDLAIMVLNQSLPGPYVKLPEKGLELQEKGYVVQEYRYPKISIAGYGKTSPDDIEYNMTYLRQAELEVQNQGMCNFILMLHAAINSHPDPQAEADRFNQETMICADDPSVYTCWGDGGGPGVLKSDYSPEDDILVGVVSFGPPLSCTQQGDGQAPGVLAKVSKYRDWIDGIMAQYI